MKQSKVFLVRTSLSLALLLLSVAPTLMAQSGRRTPKPAPPPPPPAGTTKESAPLPPPAAAKPLTQITLDVGMDRLDTFSRIPLNNYSGVYDAFVHRLRRSPSLKVVDSGMNVPRGDAIKKAKSGKEIPMVWLQLGQDRIGADRDNRVDIRDVFIEYIVYAPGTAKILTQGRTYPQAHKYRTGIPTINTGALLGDYLYNQAAQEAAERVLSGLNLPTKPLPRH